MAEFKDCYFMCHLCSHTVRIQDDHRKTIVCDRCGHKNHRLKPKSLELTLMFSITALIFYVPANLFPFMSIEFYGSHNTSTIWGGIVTLAEGGDWIIALVVFLASILIPFVKLIILFYLAFTARNGNNAKLKTKLYHIVEGIGRWSMLDIYLMAILVAIMKLGHWSNVEPKVGSIMFLFVVIFTMLASANFDPQLLWEDVTDDKPTKLV